MSNNRKLKIGFFPGVWDCLHIGHIRALKEARSKCDYLMVGINGNPTKENPNKNEPILNWEERMEMVRELKSVDSVILYSDDKVLYKLDECSPYIHIRFMGEDHKGKKHHPIKAKIVYISRKHDYSSTDFRKRIQNAKIS